MILLLDTSTPVCKMWLHLEKVHTYEWQADRTLARDLLGYLRDRLAEHGAQFSDISGIGVFRGPGSFTGLRIGMTVLNTLADSLVVPIVAEAGENWREVAVRRLDSGESDHIVLPEYGGEANITKPKK